jgi:hypothetical protein
MASIISNVREVIYATIKNAEDQYISCKFKCHLTGEHCLWAPTLLVAALEIIGEIAEISDM